MNSSHQEGVKVPVELNVEYQLRDKNGNLKPLFHENALCRFLISRNFLSPLWINGPYARLLSPLLGVWSTVPLHLANLVTNAGKAGIASRINGSGGEAAFTYIAVGTGTTAAAAGNTTLETEITDSGLARANATASRVTTTVTNDTAQLVQTFTVTGTKAVTESGVLNASSSGVLAARQVFSAINVVNGDSLQITWKLSN